MPLVCVDHSGVALKHPAIPVHVRCELHRYLFGNCNPPVPLARSRWSDCAVHPIILVLGVNPKLIWRCWPGWPRRGLARLAVARARFPLRSPAPLRHVRPPSGATQKPSDPGSARSGRGPWPSAYARLMRSTHYLSGHLHRIAKKCRLHMTFVIANK